MKTITYTIVNLTALLLTIMFVSCESGHRCLNGNHELVTEVRIPNGDFNGIVSQGSFNVYVSIDSVNEVTIEAEENLLKYIESDIKGNDLILTTKENRCIDENYTIKIYVKTTELEYLALEGSGLIECDSTSGDGFEIVLTGSGDVEAEIYSEVLETEISGSGDVFLNGTATESNLKITGSGAIDAYGLTAVDCFATISGSGDIRVNAEELLDVSITGSGNVYYIGQPVVNLSVTGSGRVFGN